MGEVAVTGRNAVVLPAGDGLVTPHWLCEGPGRKDDDVAPGAGESPGGGCGRKHNGGGGGGGGGGGHRGNHEDDEEPEGRRDPFRSNLPVVAPAACIVHVRLWLEQQRQQQLQRLPQMASLAIAGHLGASGSGPEPEALRQRLPSALADTAAFVGDSQRPVVILLSWLGAGNRQLSKYAEWYRAHGYDVVLFFNGVHTAMLPVFCRKQAIRLMRMIDEIPASRPVVVHSFSIGTGIYGYMLDAMHHGHNVTEEMVDKVRKQIRAVIFDSGPGHMRASAMASGLHAACPKVGLRVWNALAEGAFRLLRVQEGYRRAESALQHVQLPSVPQLYLYSRDDNVVKDLDQSVRQYIEAQRRRGLEVYHKMWECSQHVAHFKFHPEEYKENVERFLQRALADVEGGVKGVLDAVHDMASSTVDHGMRIGVH
ncbi:hypothetical protein CDCA_CDCA07G2112 [Cyanidium caldarium]|uniref:Transmembrane protein 53 n=1 Tax=Cyanidium caldarium TaxID=2771 RepID=A0AAV9IUS2_CYACA|nr:hypothetical protein CDCA_CDCA07G2112 [Cyanidium caldarium]